MDLNFDVSRYNLWSSAIFSVQLTGLPVTQKENSHWGWAVEIVRGLARMDARLVVEDQWAKDLYGKNEWTEVERNRFSDHVFTSQLWVIGSYELLRSVVVQMQLKEKSDKKMHEKIQKKVKSHNKVQGEKKIFIPPFCSDPFLSRVKLLLKEFARLRMPMAKLESANDFPADGPIARPGLSEMGVGWTTSANMFVTRIELADKMVRVLKGYSKEEIEGKFQVLNLYMQISGHAK